MTTDIKATKIERLNKPLTPTVRMVVFDWDGTVVDSSDRIVDAMQHAFVQRAWAAPASEAVSRLIGLPVTRMIDELSGRAPHVEQSLAVADFATRFRELAVMPPQAFTGVLECFQRLRANDYWLAVATGKSRRGLDREMSQLALVEEFVMTRTADESQPKPHPQMMLDLLDRSGLEPNQVVMVGDTVFDVEMARDAGVRSIGVDWGYHDAQELLDSGASAVASHLTDIPTLVDSLFQY